MTHSVLETTAQLLRQHYETPNLLGNKYRWTTLVRVVTKGTRPARGKTEEADWIENGQLRTARDTSQTSAAGLAEFLKTGGHSPRLAGVLRALARWWLEDDRRDAESAEAWMRSAETLRGELRALPGVSLALADRILLFVGGLPVFPIDRAALRIVGRHGWIDPSAEHDEWQAFFTRGANAEADSMAELHRWFGEIGRDHCGVEARCAQCPLRPLLPSLGPVSLSDEGSD